jgi:hypothetical protein
LKNQKRNIDSEIKKVSDDINDRNQKNNEEKKNQENPDADNNINEEELLKDNKKLIYHIPSLEENKNEPVTATTNEINSNTVNKAVTLPEDKNLKNETMGVKLVIVNDDDDEQKVSISDEDESEEEDDNE